MAGGQLQLEGGAGGLQRGLKISRFRLDLIEELGQTVFDEIKAEARDLALADLQVPAQGA